MTRSGMPPFRAGAIALVLILIGTYFAFARGLPVGDHYEIEAVFPTANNVKERQPVRIAGVDVGKVVEVRHLKPGSSVGSSRVDLQACKLEYSIVSPK